MFLINLCMYVATILPRPSQPCHQLPRSSQDIQDISFWWLLQDLWASLVMHRAYSCKHMLHIYLSVIPCVGMRVHVIIKHTAHADDLTRASQFGPHNKIGSLTLLMASRYKLESSAFFIFFFKIISICFIVSATVLPCITKCETISGPKNSWK